MMALQVYRSPLRYSAARMVAQRAPDFVAAGLAPLRLVRITPPRRPGRGWVRVRPRCRHLWLGPRFAHRRGIALFLRAGVVPFTSGPRDCG